MRRDDWPERLAAFLEAQRRTAFSWTTHNCALFAADAVEAMTGEDPVPDWRGAADKASLLARLDTDHGGDLEEAATAVMGTPLERMRMAQRGDVVSAMTVGPGGEALALGVCLGGRCAFAGSDEGMGWTTLPLTACRLAWRV